MASCLYLSKKYISSVTLEITKANKKKSCLRYCYMLQDYILNSLKFKIVRNIFELKIHDNREILKFD